MDTRNRPPRALQLSSVVFWGFTAVAAFYLLTEHRAHLFGWLPYLIVLACPVMHLFMHRGHGHRHGNGSTDKDAKAGKNEHGGACH